MTGGGTQCRIGGLLGLVERRAGIFDENTQREEGWMGDVDENVLFYDHFIDPRLDGTDAERTSTACT